MTLAPNARLARAIKDSELTRAEWADDNGMDTGQLSRILSGKRNPSIATALIIEKRTGIPVGAWARKRARNGERRAR